MFGLISSPVKIAGNKLREAEEYEFPLNDELVSVLKIEDLIKEIAANFKGKKAKGDKLNIIIEGTWFTKYNMLIKGEESKFSSRFLGKELLYRRLVIRALNPQFFSFGEDELIPYLKSKGSFDYLNDFMSLVDKNSQNIMFDIRKYKPININTNMTIREFYKRLITAFPFEINSYLLWINKNDIYNIHSTFSSVVGG